MSRKLNTKTITKDATQAQNPLTEGQQRDAQRGPNVEAAQGSFEKAVISYQAARKVGMNVSLNGRPAAESHAAAFMKWKKNKEG